MDFINTKISEQSEEPRDGVLYVVGTPIGNLGDLSPRAIGVLKKVSAIACEDTRRSGQLMRILGERKTLVSFHRHNTQRRIPTIISWLREGESIALVSDAGLPGISDPGEELVFVARSKGFEIICIPGPCAATTALISSGLPTDRFCFEGFIPIKGKQRRTRLEDIAEEKRTSIIYESPQRLVKLLEELLVLCGGERPMQVARELTKVHEQQIGPDINSALKYFKENNPKGEFTLILGGKMVQNVKVNYKQLMSEVNRLIENGESASNATKEIAKKEGVSKRYLYELLHLQDSDKKISNSNI